MPDSNRRTRTRSPIKVVEQDFNEAIDRLEANKPRHPKLRRLAAEGRLAINPSTVAMEAGRSRTLIAMETCRLPAIRNRILLATRHGDVVAPRTAAEVITRLREQVVQLKGELAAALEGQAIYFLEKEKAEREAGKWRDAFRRSEDHAQEDKKVAPMRPRRK